MDKDAAHPRAALPALHAWRIGAEAELACIPPSAVGGVSTYLQAIRVKFCIRRPAGAWRDDGERWSGDVAPHTGVC